MSMDHSHPGGMNHNYIDPPPNNAGRIKPPGSKGQVIKKTLEFTNLTFGYDYNIKQLKVTRQRDFPEGGNQDFSFSEEDLIELRAALQTLGIAVPPGDGVICR